MGVIIFYLVIRQAGPETFELTFSLFFSWQGISLVLLTLLLAIVRSFNLKFILSCQGEDKSFFEISSIWIIGYTVSYLTPISLFGGEALKAYLLNKLTDINWEKSVSSVIIDKILDTTFHAVLVILGLLFFLRFGYFSEVWLFWVIALFLLLSVGGLIFFYYRAMGKRSITLFVLNILGLEKTHLKSTKNGEFIFNTEGNILRFFSPRKAFFWKGAFISFLAHLISYIRAVFLVLFLVGAFHPARALAVEGLAYLSMFFPFPAGLGGLETATGFGFGALELGFKEGVAYGMTRRAADLTVCLFGIFLGIRALLILFQLKTFSFIDKIIKSD